MKKTTKKDRKIKKNTMHSELLQIIEQLGSRFKIGRTFGSRIYSKHYSYVTYNQIILLLKYFIEQHEDNNYVAEVYYIGRSPIMNVWNGDERILCYELEKGKKVILCEEIMGMLAKIEGLKSETTLKQ